MNYRVTIIGIVTQTVIFIAIIGATVYLANADKLDKTTTGAIFGAVIGYVGGKMHGVMLPSGTIVGKDAEKEKLP